MAIHNKLVQITESQLLDHNARDKSIISFLYSVVRLIVIIVQNIYCVSSYLVLSWIVLFPIGWFSRDLYYRIENHLYNSLLFIVSSWSLAAGIQIVETGDDIKKLIDIPSSSGDQSESSHSYCSSEKLICDHQLGVLEENSGDQTIGIKQLKKLSGCQSNNHGCHPLKTVSDNHNDANDRVNNQLDASNNPEHEQNDIPLNCDNDHSLVNGDLKREQNHHNQQINKLNNVQNDSTKKIPLHLNPVDYAINRVSSSNKQPRILFLCNHISTADVPLLMQLFSTTKNQSILWVLDAQFKATNFGLVCSSHGDYFIAKNTFKDGSLTEQALSLPGRNVFVLFPEGGFWRKRLVGSNRYALKNGLPMTKYVTHPRFGAFKDLIDERVGITHIVDATLLYDDIRQPLSIVDIVLGNRKELALLHCKVYKRDDIEPNEEWLRNIWIEKDKFMGLYYENRDLIRKKFSNKVFKTAKLDWVKVILCHLFYLLTCYLFIYRIYNASGITVHKATELYHRQSNNNQHLYS